MAEAMFRCMTRTTKTMFSRDANRSLDVWWRARYDTLKAHLEATDGEYPAWGDPEGLGSWINEAISDDEDGDGSASDQIVIELDSDCADAAVPRRGAE